MKALALAGLLLFAAATSSLADKPQRVSRAMIKAAEVSVDKQLQAIWPGDPVDLIGVTQGTYISGYGVVLLSEVNIAITSGITPFHPQITKDEFVRIHVKKLTRLAKLKTAMEDLLLGTAASLETLPGEEQVVLSITFFYWNGENTEGLPAQIVMHAPKRALVNVKSGLADRSTLASALRTEEF
jgi:hypothetical protein